MSTVANTLPVTYDQSVTQRPELHELAQVASAFFNERYRSAPPIDDERVARLKWTTSTLNGADVLVPEVEETDSDGRSRVSRRFIPVGQARDRPSLEIWMTRLLSGLLDGRYNKIAERISAIIRDLEEDERNGAEVSD